VLFSYRPRHPDEMALKAGEYVRVLDSCDDGWAVGVSEDTGDVGTFPSNYVRKVEE